jgi:hypothetical protein
MAIRGLGEVYSGGPHARGDFTTDGRRGVSGQIAEFFDSDPFQREEGQHVLSHSSTVQNMSISLKMPMSGFRLELRDFLFHRTPEQLFGKAVNLRSICLRLRNFIRLDQILIIS